MKGWNSRSVIFGAVPGPVSPTRTATVPSGIRYQAAARAAAAVALSEERNRLAW
jgi:hypothetical protein